MTKRKDSRPSEGGAVGRGSPKAKSGKRRPAPAASKPAAAGPAPHDEPAQAAGRKLPARQQKGLFPIIGIGASAGGLEALEQFLGHLASGSGVALVIVQHLDPTHKGIMVELLQRTTAMPVVQVRDRMKVQPGRVYVIPPNRDMSILHGVLHLLDPVARRGLRLPIDFFFRSLAEDRKDRSVGVILSGMGSDGTLGLRAIKEKAGAVFVQDPASAKFDSMPRSAIDAGLADVVAPVEELPARIIAFLHRDTQALKPGVVLESKTLSAIEKVFVLLRMQTGHDFSLYKNSTVYRRIERRMGIHQIGRIADYVRFIQENPAELDLLFKELLIGVTSFFRDGPVWDQLRDEAIAALLASRRPGQTLRAWTTGCSTGEEAYSLAIVFKEALEKIKPATDASLQIFATDLDGEAIDKGRQGLFPANIAADVSPERLSRFFVKNEHGYRVTKEIREMVIFAPHDLIMDPPFTKLDILTCRNLLIYLVPELQKKLMSLFHYSLNPGGVLMLGTAETVGAATDLFAPLKGKSRIYQRQGSALRTEPMEFPASLAPALPSETEHPRPARPAASLQSLAEQLLLQHYCPAGVLVNDKGDILFVSGRTGKYLEPAAGKANWNIFAMARDGLRQELATAFQRALRERGAVTVRRLQIGTNGGTQAVDLTVQAIEEPQALRGMLMIVFVDVPTPPEAVAKGKSKRASSDSAELTGLREQLRQAHEDLQSLREQMQTSQEELKSTNEELQSTNEELQSTNEELTTSKEEMQSMNEELQTVNHEQQAKMEELARANSDMKNLLNSTDIATVFLDEGLRLRRHTEQASKIIKLIPTDVGRPITDITSDLQYPGLADDVGEVLRTLVPCDREISASEGRWFVARIMPYRTMDNVIDGVVITFSNITVAKTLEARLRQTQAELENRVAKQAQTLERTRTPLSEDIPHAPNGSAAEPSPRRGRQGKDL